MLEFGRSALVVKAEYARSVNAERDKRVTGGFYYGPHKFDWDDATKARVTGAASLAGFAVGAGAQPNDLRWHGGDADFVWILQDNSILPLDAQGMFAVSQSAMAHEAAHVFAGRAIKQSGTIPADLQDNALWPALGPA
jgi:hypothetical protein